MNEADARSGRPVRIAAIGGDGIGPEVLDQGIRVLEEIAGSAHDGPEFEWVHLPWGSQFHRDTGAMIPPDAISTLTDFDAIYFGAVGWPDIPDHVTLWGLRLAICQGLDQWANVRPVEFYDGLPSRLRRDEHPPGWVVVRENSEGEYAGLGGRNLGARGRGHEVAVENALFTEFGCERIMRFAFDLAQSRGGGKVTCVTKSNAQRYGMVLWDETFARVSADYPDIETESWLVDAIAARFVLRPEQLDVVVATNLHADILSDLGGALAGSLGLAASANLNPERRFPSMFEPVHGSAPDIAGQGVANPIGTLASAAMMLEHLGWPSDAARLRAAIAGTIREGILTPDVGGRSRTVDVTDAVIRQLAAASSAASAS